MCTVCMNALLHVQLRSVRCDIELAGLAEIDNLSEVTGSSDR